MAMKEKQALYRYMKYCLSIYLIFIFGTLIYGNGKHIVAGGLLFAAGLIGLKINLYLKSKPLNWSVVYHLIYLLPLNAVILLYVVEYINNNVSNLSLIYMCGNLTIYLLISLIIYLLMRNIRTTALVSGIAAFIYGTANYYVTQFRGSPIVPADFYVLNTARTVLENYHYTITWNMVSTFLILLFWITIVFLITSSCKKIAKSKVLIATFPAAVLLGSILGFQFYTPNLDLWDLNNNVKNYGVAISLLSNIKRMNVRPPEGYSYEKLAQLVKQYDAKEKNEFTPNIIVVMNESFSDLNVLGGKLDNNIYMPYYNSLSENTIKGKVFVSVLGGGTSNTEYEFLTGNSMAFVPGTIPYQQFVVNKSPSLVTALKEQGYLATAIHPYYRDGYSRSRVYPYLGFDNFIDVESFKTPELARDIYVSDEESYEKIIEVIEDNKESGQPQFIFNITMQNHGGYLTGFYGDNAVRIPGYEKEFPDAEEFLSLIKESDTAFKTLIDYFSNIQEPTVLLMFGDHQPNLDQKFYQAMMGKTAEELSFEEYQRKFETPFFIWANYDIGAADNVLASPNYLSSILFRTAGISTTPYQNFLLELWKKIPAMNINGYLDKNGMWHGYAEDNEWKQILDQYWTIQYNNMFSKKKCEEWFATR